MVLQAAMAFLTDKTDYTHISTALTSNCNSLVSLLWWKSVSVYTIDIQALHLIKRSMQAVA